mmetsp:Transcript_22031/g.49883  ORF Transcript_22031/g.49883 Transcript_22031/m.49883 type:complete len:304 (+) Transcript_22031:728-1639(+)
MVMLRVIVLCMSLALAAAGVRVLDASEKESFRKEGYILVRGMLEGEDLESAIAAAEEVSDTSSDMPAYRNIGFNSLRGNPALRRVALQSNAAAVAQQLMMETENTDGDIHVLKDAILVFEPKKEGCGWHVDDPFFWPSPVETKGSVGLNVWIALSPMSKAFGGGLAIAPTSHSADWMTKARDAIFISQKTCNMVEVSPQHHDACEKLRRTFDMQPGDAIVHSRWLFHRSDDFTPEGVRDYEASGSKPLMRYSIRYMPGDTPIPNFPWETSVKEVPAVVGQPLKAAAQYYPRILTQLGPKVSRA